MSTSIFWTSLIGLQANINSAVTAEGQFPAPLITGKKGDRFLVGLFFHEKVVHADFSFRLMWQTNSLTLVCAVLHLSFVSDLRMKWLSFSTNSSVLALARAVPTRHSNNGWSSFRHAMPTHPWWILLVLLLYFGRSKVGADNFVMIRYNFEVPDQSGTYWYHSHVSTQYCDGLR